MTEGVRRRVRLPEEIIEFFAGVHEMIAVEEDAAMTESDDLLQDEGIFGGLRDSRKKLYEFTWVPKEEPGERWELRLLADEIDEIGSGYRREQWVKAFPRHRTA
jgi:hypothetical protein